jgi:hypothetical protein
MKSATDDALKHLPVSLPYMPHFNENTVFLYFNRYCSLIAIDKSKHLLSQLHVNLISCQWEKQNNLARIPDRMLWIWPTQHYEPPRAILCPLVFLLPKLICLSNLLTKSVPNDGYSFDVERTEWWLFFWRRAYRMMVILLT